jgi:nucleotide-binding universal stress UspA family protein
MLPFRKILCPTDFSEPSFKAMDAAVELAQHFDARLLLVHVVSPVPVVPAPEAPAGFNVALYQQELETSAKRSLADLIKERIPSEVKVEARVLLGNPAGEIVQIAGSEGVDLIVIAAHGLTGWRRIIFGSVASRVVRLATCAVLTVHVHETGLQAG